MDTQGPPVTPYTVQRVTNTSIEAVEVHHIEESPLYRQPH